MRVALGFDHRGSHLREAVFAGVAAGGHEPVDLGVETDAVRVDYPDTARAVGMAIREGRAERGVLVCGSGVGASVAACKIPGIRAAICHDAYSAHQGVEHDDMNVLCLGSGDRRAVPRPGARRAIPRRPVRRGGALSGTVGDGGGARTPE